MSRHIHLDLVGGIAGDMFAAALLDAFPDLKPRVLSDVAAVLPAALGKASCYTSSSAGIACLRFKFETTTHTAGNAHQSHFGALKQRIDAAALSTGTAEHAIAILTDLARAEAGIHQVSLDDVHFHELADWDSLADVVAAGSIAAALDDTSWSVSEVPRGGGMVRTAHGLLPAPAPATVALLQGFIWRGDGIAGERVTPTGAAILRHLIKDPGAGRAQGRLIAAGAGGGTRSLPGVPNILRVLVFEDAGAGVETIDVLSFDVDDMTGEEIGVAADRLRAVDGVLDLAIETLFGKKGRPLHGFRLLVRPAALEAVKAMCFEETSTIGLRWHVQQRAVLVRKASLTSTMARDVRVKTVARTSQETRKAESDDLAVFAGLAARRRAKTIAERGEQ